MFDSVDEVIESNAKSADWVRNNVLEFTKGLLEVMAGNTLIADRIGPSLATNLGLSEAWQHTLWRHLDHAVHAEETVKKMGAFDAV
jgi:hypothetical protein